MIGEQLKDNLDSIKTNELRDRIDVLNKRIKRAFTLLDRYPSYSIFIESRLKEVAEAERQLAGLS